MILALGVAGADAQGNIPETLFSSLEWREIGPFRGGRSAAVTGVPGKPNLFYMGATGGGVWRTKDGGQKWENISDGFFGGSIGAVAVSESDNMSSSSKIAATDCPSEPNLSDPCILTSSAMSIPVDPSDLIS